MIPTELPLLQQHQRHSSSEAAATAATCWLAAAAVYGERIVGMATPDSPDIIGAGTRSNNCRIVIGMSQPKMSGRQWDINNTSITQMVHGTQNLV